MKVILRADNKGLGKRGDIIDVSDGHARNYLLPKGLALVASVAAAVQAQAHIELDRRKLHLPDSIKVLGEYSVTAKLHHDVEFPFTIEVVKA